MYQLPLETWHDCAWGKPCEEHVGELMDEDDWYSLVSTVLDGTCTLMLGPAAVTGLLDGEHLPVHVALATYMKQRLPTDVRDRLGPSFGRLDPWKPGSVAQVILKETDPPQIKRWVEEFHKAFATDEQPLLDLAALRFDLILNTSPETIVFDLFSRVKSGTKSAYYDRTGKNPPMLPDPSQESPVVYQLYGTLDNPKSMILSDSDRLDFIVKVARGSPALPVNLTSVLHDTERSFLFLGFDLSEWHFRLLLHILADNTRRSYTSFAAEIESAPVDLDTREFYRANHRIHFFSGDLAAFCAEFRRRFEAQQPAGDADAAEIRPTVSPEAPVVFICHASEDAEVARRVAEGLRDTGIGAWLDKDNLRGGERWDDTIELTIDKVQYVVVLQSESMKAKDVGYVNKEINIALDRQSHFRSPRVFLIPAFIDDPGSKMDMFAKLHSVDLTPATGISELVKAIRRDLDWAARPTG